VLNSAVGNRIIPRSGLTPTEKGRFVTVITKYVYTFGDGKAEGSAGMKELLGGKGANLAEMTALGVTVPPGFTISTKLCNNYFENDRVFPEELEAQVDEALKQLEEMTGTKFGDEKDPLLLSARSGAPVSMPGMMDTVLNIGLNRNTVKALAAKTSNQRFAYDCYRRLVQMFGEVVLGVDGAKFENRINEMKKERGVKLDVDLTAGDLRELTESFKEIIEKSAASKFPEDPKKQLWGAITAVFDSWNNERAVEYRKINDIPEHYGTAVNIQTMVFGNMGENSATGVLFTRNPATGDRYIYGEYLENAQGEDVVAGIRNPFPLSNAQAKNEIPTMEKRMPELYSSLSSTAEMLEKHFRDVQDMEFTVQGGKLWILQTRTAKRTARAAVKAAVDMVKEGLIVTDTALMRVTPYQLDRLLHKRISPDFEGEALATGLPASPGAACGFAIFDVEEAVRRGMIGESIVLVRDETTPDDVKGMFMSKGVLTARGGMTSHAAVVARGMGRPCVCGCEALAIDHDRKRLTVGSVEVCEGDMITIDGSSGSVYAGEVPTIEPELFEEFRVLLRWADRVRRLGVRVNASTIEEATLGRELGAEGIGLCRTERMFNAADRLPVVQSMILSETTEERDKYLEKLLPMQRSDFRELFGALEGLPITIRLLDPPLHEFLPRIRGLRDELRDLRERKASPSEIRKKEELIERVSKHIEVNPMLGHRGVRMGLTYPEIYEMQARAIFLAATDAATQGIPIDLEIMIPQVCTRQELIWVRKRIDAVALEVMSETGLEIPYRFGTMIEVVRACMRAGRLAEECEFFSFGTNDLSQAVFSFSREDAERAFLPLYNERKILKDNPFQILDVKGVGRLMMICVEWGRKTKPELKIGICGEHGGEPRSIEFCNEIGLDYVSCSPYRIPVAKLAAAQATVKRKASIIGSASTAKRE
jgi:pyruvate,orthophosphate dikinase